MVRVVAMGKDNDEIDLVQLYLEHNARNGDFCWQESLRTALARQLYTATPDSDTRDVWLSVGIARLRQARSARMSNELRAVIGRALQLYEQQALTARSTVELVVAHTPGGYQSRWLPLATDRLDRAQAVLAAAKFKLALVDNRVCVVQRGLRRTGTPDVRAQLAALFADAVPLRLRTQVRPVVDGAAMPLLGSRTTAPMRAALSALGAASLEHHLATLAPRAFSLDALQLVSNYSLRWTRYSFCFALAVDSPLLERVRAELRRVHTELFGHAPPHERPLCVLFAGVARE